MQQMLPISETTITGSSGRGTNFDSGRPVLRPNLITTSALRVSEVTGKMTRAALALRHKLQYLHRIPSPILPRLQPLANNNNIDPGMIICLRLSRRIVQCPLSKSYGVGPPLFNNAMVSRYRRCKLRRKSRFKECAYYLGFAKKVHIMFLLAIEEQTDPIKSWTHFMSPPLEPR